MKQILSNTIALVFMGVFFISCNDELAPTAFNSESQNNLEKVTVNEYFYEIVLDDEEPFVECYGDLMQYHGSVGLYIEEKITPSGNVIAKWWVDYEAFDGVKLENLRTEEVWTLVNGHNPVNVVIKENGFYRINYQWSELYKMGKKTLHVHLKGQFMVMPDGTVKQDRESYTCR